MAKEANTGLQSRLEELTEQNLVLERDALSVQKIKNDYDTKLAKLKLRYEMARGFARRVSEVAGLLAEIGEKAQNNMMNLAEIKANLEFIGLLQGPTPPELSTEVKALGERRAPIYDARDVFEDLLASVREVLGISEVYAAFEGSAAADDDVEVGATDGDDDEDGDEEIED
ncbi:hypothetical protein AALP_AA2G072400 [Arabis alpina]|uniref:Uncharacterized protein n=1 Tax=Arabis alpina TaxID=50452 RepID=A0A087HFU8_ARAAL|nr:hypothetical protein AALP_AA2G072400 [Arabis alpina]